MPGADFSPICGISEYTRSNEILVAVMVLLSAEPTEMINQLLEAGSRMLIIYVPYALVLGLAFAVRSLPSVDVRSLTSVLIFGPFTLIRPLIVVCGVIWGFLAAPGFVTLLLSLLVLALMLSLGWVLDRLSSSESKFL